MNEVVIGVDAGTSIVKSVAFDLDGRLVAIASTPNRYHVGAAGAVTQSPGHAWEDCVRTLRELVGKLGRAQVVGVGVTAQGDGTWLVGERDSAVGDAWLWLDGRAGPTVRRLRENPGEPVRFLKTGTALNTCQQGAQLAHMLAVEPERLGVAQTAMHAKDWLFLKLTGVRATDPSESAFTFGDFRTRAYDDEVIAALGLSDHRRLLPDILDGAAQASPLTAAAAAQTGLRAGTPISLGYIDIVCTALGAGVVTEGAPARCSVLGSTGVHMRAARAEAVILSPERSGWTIPLPIPGFVVQAQSNMAATLNIDWALSLAADLMADMGVPVARADLIGRLEGWLEVSPPGAALYHPYISEAGERGPFVNDRARAGFIGLSAAHRFPDLIRAIVEGVGLAARDCYDAMGSSKSEVRLSGGAGRSPGLRAILAACLDAPVRMSLREEAGAAGAAMIAACAVGAFPDMHAAIARWVAPQLGPRQEPDARLARIYQDIFAAYALGRRALEPVWDRLAEARAQSAQI
jgi:erythritol kinase